MDQGERPRWSRPRIWQLEKGERERIEESWGTLREIKDADEEVAAPFF